MRLRFICALLLTAIFLAAGSSAQVFRVQGGESTLLNAQGGSVEFKAPNYDGTVGLGFYNGRFEFGAETRYLFHKYTLLAGDDSVPFVLPTDVFDASHYFSARGAGVTRKYADQNFYAFAGTTSTWLGTGFFNAATSDDPVGLFFYERELSPELKFFSRNIASNRQTSLQSIEWQPEKWMKAAVTGGLGSNEKYFATSLDTETQKLAFKSSYVITGDMFRRITVSSPMSSEPNKENVQMLYRPDSHISITTGHQNILEPLTPDGPMQQASVNQFSTDLHLERFYFGTGIFSSTTEGRKSHGTNLYLGRRFGQRLEANTNYFVSTSQGGQKSTILSGTVRENISPRLSLLQLVSRAAGQTIVSFGGDFTSNRLLLRADYQNVYLPFRPDRPFQQALALNAAFRVFGPLQITAASNVDPQGHLRYTFGASTYLYRWGGMSLNANSPDSFSIAKYVVEGMVKDDQNAPVEGAALHIANQVAYTDSTGHFMVRFSKHGPFSLSLAPEEFITTGLYAVVSAPSQVRAESEDTASDVQIVVRRVPPPQSKMYKQ
ncbi:MAG TPA: carboxypeptidase-like regulatory domain-containing protein [Terriglobales bacterium]|jgi:hypothetical protein